MSNFSKYLELHSESIQKAIRAVTDRSFYAHWPEIPSGKIYGETAQAEGEERFKAMINSIFTFPHQSGTVSSTVGEEQSPYGFPMGILYPRFDIDETIKKSVIAQKTWKAISASERAAILLEVLERASKKFFDIAFATQHTTGQGFMMSFQASGPHAFDRALEAIAVGLKSLQSFESSVTWVKPMGKMEVTVQKEFVSVPKGIGVVVGCSTFPLWNSLPGMFANLITGNTTIAKTHPLSVLPMAIFVHSAQETLVSLGVDPHIIQIVVDSKDQPKTIELCSHPDVQIIDYTGSTKFGNVLEEIAQKNKKVIFTEKAGVNSVLIDSVKSLDAVADNLAFSISLYSGQMCTAPQNIFIPKDGIQTSDGSISFDEVAQTIVAKVQQLATNPKAGAGTLGALQNNDTYNRVKEVTTVGGTVLLESQKIEQPNFESARSFSPVVIQLDQKDSTIYSKEWFGPIAFVIPVDTAEKGIEVMSDLIRKEGALSASLYTQNPSIEEKATEEIVESGAPLSINFTGPIWVNQSASFSDMHGSGASPAGNATFSDLSFVSNRYNVIGVRKVS